MANISAPPESSSRGGKREGAGPKKKDVTKKVSSTRFDTDVLAAYEATGKGWQTRVNMALQEWLKSNDPATLNKG